MTPAKPKTPGRPLTEHERALIDAIHTEVRYGHGATCPQLAARTGQTPQGVTRVAASAVRKGLINRWVAKGTVYYALTPNGRALAKVHADLQATR